MAEGKEGKGSGEEVVLCDNLQILPKDIVDTYGPNIKKLDLTENSIKTGANFELLKKLEVLVLDKNSFESFAEWPVISTLHTLWLNNNNITDIGALMDSIAKLFPNLKYLSLMKNPSVPDMYFSDNEYEAYMRHRFYVIWRLKKLQFLDATAISAEERQEAEKKGKFMQVAKPKPQPKAAPSSPAPGDEDKSQQNDQKEQAPQEHKPKVATFLAKGKARYDGSNSEGNRFIVNDDL